MLTVGNIIMVCAQLASFHLYKYTEQRTFQHKPKMVNTECKLCA